MSNKDTGQWDHVIESLSSNSNPPGGYNRMLREAVENSLHRMSYPEYVAKKIHVIIIDYNQRDRWSRGGSPPASLIKIDYNLRFFAIWLHSGLRFRSIEPLYSSAGDRPGCAASRNTTWRLKSWRRQIARTWRARTPLYHSVCSYRTD